MTPAFQVAQQIGNQTAKGLRAANDENKIGEILARAKSAGPEYYQDAMTRILSEVSPENQQNALAVLQNIEQRSQRQLAQKSYEKYGLDPNLGEGLNKEILKQRGTEKMLENIFSSPEFSNENIGNNASNIEHNSSKGEVAPSEIRSLESQIVPDKKIAELSIVNPNLAKQLQARNEQIRKQIERKQDVERSRFEAERKYHTQYSQKQEEEFNKLAQSVERKEVALDFARNAVESKNLSFLSPDKLADATGLDIFRTSKGAQLITAAKENLLSNISRVSAKGQNMWFEQRLNSMFPRIGQSQEANLTTQEMLEAETAMDRAEITAFERLSAQDEKDLGYVRKDIGSRARKEASEIKNQIFNRAKYRIREIEEQEIGLKKLKNQVGKPTLKGTPLTLTMARLYKEKFGENAKKAAKDNGYYIPSIEELQLYQQVPQQYREQL